MFGLLTLIERRLPVVLFRDFSRERCQSTSWVLPKQRVWVLRQLSTEVSLIQEPGKRGDAANVWRKSRFGWWLRRGVPFEMASLFSIGFKAVLHLENNKVHVYNNTKAANEGG